jgi:hypothetical protein
MFEAYAQRRKPVTAANKVSMGSSQGGGFASTYQIRFNHASSSLSALSR